MIQTTKEKIIEAASKCPQAEEALMILFPEVFKQQPILIKTREESTTDNWLRNILLVDDNTDRYLISMGESDTLILNAAHFNYSMSDCYLKRGVLVQDLVITRK